MGWDIQWIEEGTSRKPTSKGGLPLEKVAPDVSCKTENYTNLASSFCCD